MGDSALWDVVTAPFSTWYEAKMLIESASSISSDAMHVIAGVLLQILCALLLRRPLSAWKPWLAAFVLILFNEAVDLWVERWPSLAMQLGEGAKDILLTLFLPTVLLFTVRWAPGLVRPRRR